MTQIAVEPIGTIKTPFKQKFAIPRQPNLVNAPGCIIMAPKFSDPGVFKGLENYSHLWLLFHFNATAQAGWKPTVKAPRLGGNKTLGVFASRSTHRPNGLGLSVVKNLGWQSDENGLELDVSGVDLLDGTPIVDIKPYLPYADSLATSQAHVEDKQTLVAPPTKPVYFRPAAENELAALNQRYPQFKDVVVGILAQDPRPAYKVRRSQDDKLYSVQLFDVDVHWRVENEQIWVEGFTPLVSL